MKSLFTMLATAGIMVAGITAASADYCSDQAKHDANAQAAKKTIVGTVGGCVVGKLLGGKCGGGAAVGGVGGFAIGSAQWHDAYNASYQNCINSHPPVKVKTITKVYSGPKQGSQAWIADCSSKYANFDPNTGYYSYESFTGDTVNKVCTLP